VTPLESAAQLAELARQTATSAEEDRRLDSKFISGLRESGLGCMGLPESAGGSGVDVATFLEVMRTIAHGDGSAGWVTMIYASSSLAGHYRLSRGP
jgi:alkylation response protein AidB-like acyl-CoA dehydrogenase